MNKKYAAFIVTFERPQILARTIEALFKQTAPPAKILVVDNSLTFDTQDLIEKLTKLDSRVEYYRMGYNSGPAGGVYLGLTALEKQGFEFVQWIDDDNPPLFADVNERLLKIFGENENIGVVGQSGARFSKTFGFLIRYKDKDINRPGNLDVDYIGGSQKMIVKADIIRKGCLPNRDLFFGFEDLSFCLKVKAKGYRILVPTDLFLKLRIHSNRLGQTKFENIESWRVYYSIRSLVYICLYEQRLVLPLFFICLKIIIDLIKGKRKFRAKAFIHGIIGKTGIIIKPNEKTI